MLRLAFLIACLLALFTATEARADVGGGWRCSSNDQCDPGLVCMYGRCGTISDGGNFGVVPGGRRGGGGGCSVAAGSAASYGFVGAAAAALLVAAGLRRRRRNG